jgi:hypothetical protein
MHTMTLTTVLTIVVIVRIMELTDLNCPLVTVKVSTMAMILNGMLY